MKKYAVKVSYTFHGHYLVAAENKKEAKEIVRTDAGLTIGEIHTSNNSVVNWDFDTHPVKTTIV